MLVLQNGLDVEADAANVVGLDRVLGGCCFLCSNKVGPGHVRHLLDLRDRVVLLLADGNPAEPPGETERVLRIGRELVSAGIDAKTTGDLLAARWRKLMWNVPFNGLSVVLDASTKELVDDENAVALVETVIREVHDAAVALGVAVDEAMIQKTIDVTRKMVPYDASMRIDDRYRRPMEVEAIFGNPLRAAAAKGVSMPSVSMLYRELKFLDARNARLGPLTGWSQ